MKTKQQLFHHKNWKNIQGTWDIEDAWEDGTSIVDSLKYSYCGGGYCMLIISYQDDRERDGLIHMYRSCVSGDLGQTKVEANDYKKIQICKNNFNLYGGDYPCKNKYSIDDTCVTWNIEELNSSSLIVSSPIRGNFYKIKYKKI